MSRRGTETALAVWTLVLLVAYVPGELWGSWRNGLLNPNLWIDIIAMILLLWGSIHSLRRRPLPSPEALCIAIAWASANAWRATTRRMEYLQAGGTLDHGTAEIWVVAVGTAIALAMFAVSLALVILKHRDEARLS